MGIKDFINKKKTIEENEEIKGKYLLLEIFACSDGGQVMIKQTYFNSEGQAIQSFYKAFNSEDCFEYEYEDSIEKEEGDCAEVPCVILNENYLEDMEGKEFDIIKKAHIRKIKKESRLRFKWCSTNWYTLFKLYK